jgi:hypothetical protein
MIKISFLIIILTPQDWLVQAAVVVCDGDEGDAGRPVLQGFNKNIPVVDLSVVQA